MEPAAAAAAATRDGGSERDWHWDRHLHRHMHSRDAVGVRLPRPLFAPRHSQLATWKQVHDHFILAS